MTNCKTERRDSITRCYVPVKKPTVNIKKPNGYILFENDLIVVIATGMVKPSDNAKTGKMIQIWILVKAENPVAANKSGADEAVCGDCPLRGINGAERVCYVNLGQAPLGIWKAWQRGSYPKVTPELMKSFMDLKVRFGAYGEPVKMPHNIVKMIAELSANWTGYTHQWRNPIFDGYKQFFMASADKASDVAKANAKGWRTFRQLVDGEKPLASEIICPNYTKGVQCESCGLCKGASIGAKNIAIYSHGSGKKHFTKVRG